MIEHEASEREREKAMDGSGSDTDGGKAVRVRRCGSDGFSRVRNSKLLSFCVFFFFRKTMKKQSSREEIKTNCTVFMHKKAVAGVSKCNNEFTVFSPSCERSGATG